MPSFLFEGAPVEYKDGESVLATLLRNHVAVENGCHAGACQRCLLRSKSTPPTMAQAGLDDLLVEQGAFLACQAKSENLECIERLHPEVRRQFSATLREKRVVSGDVMILTLDVSDWASKPGRFIHLSNELGVSRSYSVATPAWLPATTLQLHVRLVPGGLMSDSLKSARLNDSFYVQGPYGKCFYRVESNHAPLLLIGTGTGLAPLYGIATDALLKGHLGPIHLFHGARSSEKLYFREELVALRSQFSNFHYHACVETEPRFDELVGSPLSHALASHNELEGYKVYLCGHPQLVRVGQKKCYLAGASLADIATDAFAPNQISPMETSN